jgi:phosphomannomutase
LIARLREDKTLLRELLAPQGGPVEMIDETDGLRVHFASGDIVHLRPSGNAPELRCYAESTSVRSAKQLCDDCLLRLMKA